MGHSVGIFSDICRTRIPYHVVTSFECHLSGVHAGGFMRGISGCQDEGAYSIVLSGGYEDDIDLGVTLCVSLILVLGVSDSFVYAKYIYRIRWVRHPLTSTLYNFIYVVGGRDKSVRDTFACCQWSTYLSSASGGLGPKRVINPSTIPRTRRSRYCAHNSSSLTADRSVLRHLRQLGAPFVLCVVSNWTLHMLLRKGQSFSILLPICPIAF